MALPTLVTGTRLQSNDATTLRIPDGTGDYDVSTNPTGWGTPNTDPSVITSFADAYANDGVCLRIRITYTSPEDPSTEIVYDYLDPYLLFGPFTTSADLVFDITADILVTGGVGQGNSEDQLLDGWYKIEYFILDYVGGASSSANTDTTENLLDGIVRTTIYDNLRLVPYNYDYQYYTRSNKEWATVVDPIYQYSLYRGMLSDLSIGRKTEILNTLELLTRISS